MILTSRLRSPSLFFDRRATEGPATLSASSIACSTGGGGRTETRDASIETHGIARGTGDAVRTRWRACSIAGAHALRLRAQSINDGDIEYIFVLFVLTI